MSETQELIYEVRDGIGWITFNRPEARNAFTFAMYERLQEICTNAEPGGEARVLVMRGAGGKAFGAGTDMTQFRAFSKPEDAWAYEDRMERVFEAIESCPLPTIAAINGACTGGGAAIAAACDLRIASPTLKYGFPVARTLGNCLSVSNLARLSELMGAARVRDVIMTARLVEAEEAKAIGLVSEIAEDVDARAQELAETVAGHAPLTLRATKEGLRRLRVAAAHVDDRDLIEMCYMSDDFREGLDAFLSKRKPAWQGK
ncbi:enoyl-CoA hydratase/isomerase family protein [Dichotomicrobium thermohalophilum]|uniref:Enoyl-CoA hydratase/carnithine racemase n=1 Tax=Dichotomicrobium thermohalophilum TaxID=933063 RepID=A0A397Q5Z8_9HYPH|nr:enoyl-CoA hydratase/isomerase family protein [Dichotomicrobium thermohalophilum]RIA55235.1 enoyl-CoA hydratase/carnithine racemase [Dichotomicrobium thermohalophilum]